MLLFIYWDRMMLSVLVENWWSKNKVSNFFFQPDEIDDSNVISISQDLGRVARLKKFEENLPTDLSPEKDIYECSKEYLVSDVVFIIMTVQDRVQYGTLALLLYKIDIQNRIIHFPISVFAFAFAFLQFCIC